MPEKRVFLMHEQFAGLRPGLVKEALDGPYREMHAQPASPEDKAESGGLKADR